MLEDLINKARTLVQTRVELSDLISHYPLGRMAFWASIIGKRLSIMQGGWSQRAVEYPWVLNNLELVEEGSLVLDVGCAESLLSHELIGRGFRSVGIDLRNWPFKDKRATFIKENILNTKLPDDLFDAIIAISTIEHIGLKTYEQDSEDLDADFRAVKELKRILKEGGLLFITTPYRGAEKIRVVRGRISERQYNQERLEKLVSSFQILKEKYFYPLKGNRSR